MIRQNKSGFTLVELLAVVVILAIILAIAVPSISNVINSSRKSAMESDAKLLLKAVDLKKLQNDDFNPLDYNDNLEGLLTSLNISADNYENIVFTTNNNKLLIMVEGKGKWEGLTACGSYRNMKVSEDGCELDFIPPVITLIGDDPFEHDLGVSYVDPGTNVTDNSGEVIEVNIDTSTLNVNVLGEYTVSYTATDSSGNTATTTRTVKVIKNEFSATEGVNKPRLAEGMTAIKWDGNDWVKVDDPDNDTSWYNYANKEWANAVTSDCNTPGDYDTCSMWVWIPRYAYQIATLYHTASATSAGTVNIKFLKNTSNKDKDNVEVATTPTYSGASQTNFIKHPAFKFGDKELTGIWVAKFAMSGTTSSLISKPGNEALTYVVLGNLFTAARNMEKNSMYGWDETKVGTLNADGTFTPDTNNIDTHLIKNIEWGAMAYLAQSIYGKNAQVTLNTSREIAGGGTGSTYMSNRGQSTTGKIEGIYDVAGLQQYVMGNLNNIGGASSLAPTNLNDRYIDRYTGYNNTIYGDAVWETSAGDSVNSHNSWYSDNSSGMTTDDPWFVRGSNRNASDFGGIYAFQKQNGRAVGGTGFRCVIVVEDL